MNYLSVCSGIEAASVAWKPIGWKCVGVSEVDKLPCSVLRYRFPDVPNYGDMTRFKEWNIEPGSADILVGGTPCQSFSIAGLRGGLEDGRGNLALTYCRILHCLRPKWFVWENVPGVLSSNGGRDFGSILGAMVELGYGVSYRVLDAQYFGVPQRRRRVFVVGCLGNWISAAKVLFEPLGVFRDSKKGGKKKSSVAALTANGVGTCGADDNQCQAGHLIAAALTGRPYSDKAAEESKLIAYQCHGTNVGEIGTLRKGNGNATGGVPFLPQAYRTAGDGCVYDEGDKTAPLTTSTDPNANIITISTGSISHCLNAGGMGRQDYETETMVACTLPASEGGVSSGYHPVVAAAVGVRRLTPRECERLQGFPDDWTLVTHGPKGKPAADGPRYKAIGNSMAVPVMRWIGERIQLIASQQ